MKLLALRLFMPMESKEAAKASRNMTPEKGSILGNSPNKPISKVSKVAVLVK